jgi:DNA-binding transcriptional MerR regulator
MPEKFMSARELAKAAKEPLSTVSFWAGEKLLTYQRKNGRTRLFPAEESILRIQYIRRRQSQPEGCRLDDIRRELGQNKHREGRGRKA